MYCVFVSAVDAVEYLVVLAVMLVGSFFSDVCFWRLCIAAFCFIWNVRRVLFRFVFELQSAVPA